MSERESRRILSRILESLGGGEKSESHDCGGGGKGGGKLKGSSSGSKLDGKRAGFAEEGGVWAF